MGRDILGLERVTYFDAFRNVPGTITGTHIRPNSVGLNAKTQRRRRRVRKRLLNNEPTLFKYSSLLVHVMVRTTLKSP